MPDLPRISDAEWAVMTAVWDRPPRTAQEVAAALADRGWSPRTVKTLLARLVKKGALGFVEEGKRYRYHPRVEREAYAELEGRELLSRHAGAVSPLLATFVREGDLGPDEIAALRRTLDELEREEGR